MLLATSVGPNLPTVYPIDPVPTSRKSQVRTCALGIVPWPELRMRCLDAPVWIPVHMHVGHSPHVWKYGKLC